MRTSLVCLLAVPLLAAAPAEDPAKRLAELQGAWRLVSAAMEKDEALLPERRPVLIIRGDRVLYGGEELARITADPATDPKLLDLHFRAPERNYEGVYAVEKDRLKICLNGRSEGVKERPNAFTLEGHPAWRLLALERIKAEEAGPGSGFVGVVLGIDDARKEIVIRDVLPNSPAQKAGCRKGDVMLAVESTAVASLRDAIDAVRRVEPGREVTFRVRRADAEREIRIRVGLLPLAALVGLE
jgi:uncharacterized protein (TIGR03067 family)